jgi:cell division septal protein FtsQ
MGGAFRVRQVQVVGANLPVDTMVQTAGVAGQNIFLVRSDEVVARLSTLRDIDVWRVDTVFPDHVTIYARLRVASAAWQDGKTLYLLDWDGRVIRQVATTTLPIISGVAGSRLLGPGMVRAVQQAVKVLPGVPQGAIAAFRLGPTAGLTIVGRSGWKADIGTGTPQTLVNRVVTLAAFLTTMRARAARLTFIDLRYHFPYARFAGP